MAHAGQLQPPSAGSSAGPSPSPSPSAGPGARGLELAAGLTRRLRPSVLHAASNHANARLALALRERYGLPVVYEVRGFWEDTWLSRYPDAAERASSELYQRNRDLETRCMLAADLVVTLGEAMREEIAARGVPGEKILIVPNAVSGSSSGRCPTRPPSAKISASSRTST